MEGSNVNKDEALSKIVKNAERLQRLTEDILDVARIESQTLKLEKSNFDLRDTAATVSMTIEIGYEMARTWSLYCLMLIKQPL